MIRHPKLTQRLVVLDRTNPLTRGLIGAFNYNADARKLHDANGLLTCTTNSNILGTDFTSFGAGYGGFLSAATKSFRTSRNCLNLGISDISAMSIVAILYPTSASFGYVFTTSNGAIHFARNSNGNQNRMFFNRAHSTTAYNLESPAQLGNPINNIQFWAFSMPNFNTVSDGIIFKNGGFYAPHTTASTNSAGTPTSINTAFVHGAGFGSSSFIGGFAYLLVYNRAISRGEILSLYNNPWCIYKHLNPLDVKSSSGITYIFLNSDISIDHIVNNSVNLNKRCYSDVITDVVTNNNNFSLTKNIGVNSSTDTSIGSSCNLVKFCGCGISTDTILDPFLLKSINLNSVISDDTILGGSCSLTKNCFGAISTDTICNDVSISISKRLLCVMSTDTILNVSFISTVYVSCSILLDTVLGVDLTKGISLNSQMLTDTILNISATKTHTLLVQLSSDTIVNGSINLNKNLYTAISLDTILNGAFTPAATEPVMTYSIVVNVASQLNLSVSQ